ncbi:hypothetical protein Fuma_05610 [Fuerstiella marisgermanici]|uniref:Uncharacterized protein n=1 Tax=Fuerstiella marisgermanici TaxID=1891926 RepID=A0A1P8WPE8_9PLAN|nr:hypothetical protein Fuma_05610 [Fuerstiella marisgermanici]
MNGTPTFAPAVSERLPYITNEVIVDGTGLRPWTQSAFQLSLHSLVVTGTHELNNLQLNDRVGLAEHCRTTFQRSSDLEALLVFEYAPMTECTRGCGRSLPIG